MSETNTSYATRRKDRLRNLPRFLLAPVPLFPAQPALSRIVTYVADHRPELFARLGVHINTVYIIDPVNLPFVLRLCPNPEYPELTAHRRREDIEYGARISGSFLTLLGLIDGRFDGDSMFFTRELKIEGNTEAVVCLSNAIDDLEGSIMDDITEACGPLSRPLKRALSIIRKQDRVNPLSPRGEG